MKNAEIKEARQLAGLTQKEMSELFNIPRRTIEDWDREINTPPDWVADLLLEKLRKIQKEKKMSLKKVVNAARFAAFEEIRAALGDKFKNLPENFSIYKISDFKKAEYIIITHKTQLNSVTFKEAGIENPAEVKKIASVHKKTRQAFLY